MGFPGQTGKPFFIVKYGNRILGGSYSWVLVWVLVHACVFRLNAQVTHTIVDSISAQERAALAAALVAAGLGTSSNLNSVVSSVNGLSSPINGVTYAVQTASSEIQVGIQQSANQIVGGLTGVRSDISYGNGQLGSINSSSATIAANTAPVVSGGETWTLGLLSFKQMQNFQNVYGLGQTNLYTGDELPPVQVSNSVPNLLERSATNLEWIAAMLSGSNGLVLNISNNVTFTNGEAGMVGTNWNDWFGRTATGTENTAAAATNYGIRTVNALAGIDGQLREVTNLLHLSTDGTWSRLDELNSNSVRHVALITNSVWQSGALISSNLARMGTNLSDAFYTNSEALLLSNSNLLSGVSNAIAGLRGAGSATGGVAQTADVIPEDWRGPGLTNSVLSMVGLSTQAIGDAASGMRGKITTVSASLSGWEALGLYRREDWVWSWGGCPP